VLKIRIKRAERLAAESGDNTELLELRKQLQELEGEVQQFTACQDLQNTSFAGLDDGAAGFKISPRDKEARSDHSLSSSPKDDKPKEEDFKAGLLLKEKEAHELEIILQKKSQEVVSLSQQKLEMESIESELCIKEAELLNWLIKNKISNVDDIDMFFNTQKLLEDSVQEFSLREQINARKNKLDIVTFDYDYRIETLKKLRASDMENSVKELVYLHCLMQQLKHGPD